VSVINQMLQGLDKGVQQQQVQSKQGAVVVATPRNNTAIICLVVAIVVVGLLGAYLFVQKQTAAQTQADLQKKTVIQKQPTVQKQPLVQKQQAAQKQAALAEPMINTVALPVVTDNTNKVDEVSITNDLIDKPVLVASAEKQSTLVPAAVATAAIKPVTKVEPARVVTTQVVESKPVLAAPATRVNSTVVPDPIESKPQVTEPTHAMDTTNELTTEENTVSIKAVTRTPVEQAKLYAKQAESALLAGDKERAKKLFHKVLKLDRKHNLSREKLAALLYGEQRTQSAVNVLQEGLSLSPSYSNFRLMLARIYLQKKNKPQAYYYLKPHQPDIEGNLDYYAILAGLAQNLNDLDTALITYKKLTEYEPNRAKWWLGLGITADKAKQVKLALSAYHTAQEMGQLSASSRNYINTRIAQLEKQ